MASTIYIDGFDFSNDVKAIPTIEQTSPEWGQIDNIIQNDIVNLELQTSLKPFFDNGRDITAIPVKIYNDNELIFNGAINTIEYNQRNIIVTAQSFTTLLFNNVITGDKFAYVKENTLPVDVIKELLDLSEEVIKQKFPNESFTLNSISYQTAYNLQSDQNLYFNVYCDNISYYNCIQKICENSCSILYYKNGEFFYQMYQTDIASAVELDDDDFFSFPKTQPQASDTITYNQIDVRFGNDTSLLAIQGEEPEKASKTINMSVGQADIEVSSSALTTAQYIKDLYDDIYTGNRQFIEAEIRKPLESILGKNVYIKYNDVNYRIITFNTQSKIKTFIRGESIL